MQAISNDKNNDAAPPCPICGKTVDAKYAPFCSKRCADVDLHRWLSGSYAIPTLPDEEESADDPDSAEE